MAFHDVLFPMPIKIGAEFGPRRDLEEVKARGGTSRRNATQADPTFFASFSVPPDRHELREAMRDFHHARRGGLFSFPVEDPSDFKSSAFDLAISDTDQTIGTGDAAQVAFQLIKTYEPAGPLPWVRTIDKPVVSTVVVALDGVPQASGWTVNRLTGIVTFSVAPGAGVVVTAGYEFHVVMKFKNKLLPARLITPDLIEYSNIELEGAKNE